MALVQYHNSSIPYFEGICTESLGYVDYCNIVGILGVSYGAGVVRYHYSVI